jgi:hypothetical protein
VSGETRCFLHVPKSAGTSVREMLEAALPSGSLAYRRTERSTFCCFDDFDRLTPEAREEIAANDAEIRALAEYPAVCGHFSLQTLERLAPRSQIATVLREPRSRVISQYLYLRFKTGLRTRWAAYGIHTAAEGTLSELLSEPRVATATDNKACRMLLHDDARIQDGRFIDTGELESVAEAAWERLTDLGFVGILERPGEAWSGVGDLFGVELRPEYRNVTGGEEIQPGMLPVPPLGGAATLELLERRSAADAILYRRVASRFVGGDEPARSLADSAFAEQLVRYGEFTSAALAELENERRAHAALTEEVDDERRAHAQTAERLQACSGDLARSTAMLETLTRSRSWRLTAPLRRVRQALHRPPGDEP